MLLPPVSFHAVPLPCLPGKRWRVCRARTACCVCRRRATGSSCRRCRASWSSLSAARTPWRPRTGARVCVCVAAPPYDGMLLCYGLDSAGPDCTEMKNCVPVVESSRQCAGLNVPQLVRGLCSFIPALIPLSGFLPSCHSISSSHSFCPSFLPPSHSPSLSFPVPLGCLQVESAAGV